MEKSKEVKKCHKCGERLKKIKTEITVRTENSRPDDPYDGGYDNLYFNFCPCWKEK